MATSRDDMEKDLTFRRFEEGDHEYKRIGDDIFNEDNSYKCPTYVHRTPPCQGSCPSGEDIRGWLQIVRGIEKPSADMSMEEYAFRRSTDANPFPAMMGRVCPAPCEDGCNRNNVEEQPHHLGCDFFRDEDGVMCMAPRKYIEKMISSYQRMFGSKPKLNVPFWPSDSRV